MHISILSLAVFFVACAGAPRSTPEVMPEVAAEFGALYNDPDEQRMLALWSPQHVTTGVTSTEYFEPLRAQLGACGEPQFMWSFAKRGARFSYPCEHGALEASIRLDEAGKIVDVGAGAAGVPAPEAVTSAAETVLASLPWDPGTERPFKHNLDRGVTEKLGKCQLVRPWVVHGSGAVFHTECEHGDAALLTVRLHTDGTLAYVSLVHSKTIYFGPPVWLPEPRA